MNKHYSTPIAWLCAVVVVGSLAACSPSTASMPTAASGFEAFKACMQQRGITLAEQGVHGTNPNSAQFRNAERACSPLYKKPVVVDRQQFDPSAMILRYAQCMRQHGIATTDPQKDQYGNWGVQSRGLNAYANSPELVAAERACEQIMRSRVAPSAAPDESNP
jgi:hypothetical protein